MKRVCLIKLGYYPELRLLKRSADTLANQGYDVDVICLKGNGEKRRETHGNIHIYRIPGEHHRRGLFRYLFEYSYFFLMASILLTWLSLKKKYDVIEVCTMPDFLVFTTIIPRLQGTKIVLYFWENMPQLFKLSYNITEKHPGIRLLRFIEKISAAYAHHIIVADGIPYKKVLVASGVPEDKISVVLNVPDDPAFNLSSVDELKDGNHFHVIVTTTHSQRYGIQTLIEAVPYLLKDIPELRVDITGDGEMRSEFENLTDELGVREYVNFTGMISVSDLTSYVARAQVGVAPSLYDIGVPNKVFDYFALGTPCVASNLPSLRETFDGDCIRYFRPGDARDLAEKILDLYRDPEQRAAMVRRGLDFYRKCQWQVMKQEYLKVYTHYVASGNGHKGS